MQINKVFSRKSIRPLSIFGTFTLLWLCFISVFYVSCSSDSTVKKEETLTTGKTIIYADEAYEKILSDLRFIYEIKYPDSEIEFSFSNEDEVLNLLYNDSAKVVIVSEEPEKKILDHYRKKGFSLAICPLAKDGIVLLVNKNCPLEKLTRQQLMQLVNGQINSWSQLPGADPNAGPLILGFNTKGSGIIKYFRKHYLQSNQAFSPNSKTFNGTQSLLDSISRYANIIGFIPYNYISDKDDSTARQIKEKFKIISLESLKDSSQFVLPSQTSLADSSYPLIRRVLAINHEGKSGLGTGFVIYAASHRGQRLILKSGLVPATMPARQIRLIKKNLKFN